MDLTSIFSHKQKWDFVLILTYDVDLKFFFETELLSKISVKNNITIAVDYNNYQKLFIDPKELPNYLGVYYNLEAVKIQKGGCFHPKFYLFLSDDEAFISIGSHNLTKSGFKKNLETVLCFNFRKNELEKDSLLFLTQIKQFLKKSFLDQNSIVETVSVNFKKIVADIVSSNFFKDIDELTIPENNQVFFLSSLEGGIFSQVESILKSPIKKMKILSPFFDDSNDSFDLVKSKTPKVDIYIPQKYSSFPKHLFDKKPLDTQINFYKVHCIDQSFERFIHAKLFSIETRENIWRFAGSSNFSNPGFLNNSYPRNFEIGLLFSDRNQKFIDLPIVESSKIQDFSELICTSTQKEKISTEDSDNLNGIQIIKNAIYLDGKIYFSITESFKNKHPNDFHLKYTANLFLNKSFEDQYSIKLNKKNTNKEEDFSIQPELEIEGNTQIHFVIISNNEEFKSIPCFVNRERHEPNFLPVLGANAYYKCLRIGGEEGIKKAFDIARTSGKDNWMFYLLSSWNLEKILIGLNGNQENIENEQEFKSPTLTGTKKKKKIKKNLHTTLTLSDMFKRLEGYIKEVHTNKKLNKEGLDFYNNYCFPLFTEITIIFCEILENQEKLKKMNPHIVYPKYSWLQNYNKYKGYLYFFFKELNQILNQKKNTELAKSSEFSVFLSNSLSWVGKHTDKIIIEFNKTYKKDLLALKMNIIDQQKI